MLRFRKRSHDRPSFPLLRGRSTEPSTASTSRHASTSSLAESLTTSIANSITASNAYSVSTATPLTPTVPLSTLIHPLRYLASSLHARVYELPRRSPRLLKVC